MALIKKAKDHILRFMLGETVVPRGLVDLQKYFRTYGSIDFDYKKEGGRIIGISKNFRYGSIVTSGKNTNELDENIKDAIMTSFEVPSSYAKETQLYKVGEPQKKCASKYALA